jgi:zinc transport system ATP-binding protein
MADIVPKDLIRLDDVGCRMGRTQILSGISLTIAPGEIVTVIGPNGAGKTTLAKLVLGVLQPTAGTVNRYSGLTVGYVPQKLTVDPSLPLTVRRFMGLTTRVTRDAVDEALAQTGVAPLAGRQFNALSGGEMQRVLMARAILRRPSLLVLDEPTQGVDVTGQIELFQLIRKIREVLGCAVMMISHDLHIVMSATDRVLCLNTHLCCDGTPEMVANNPEYRRLFGVRGVQELAMYEHDLGHHHAHHATPASEKNDAA